MTAKDEGTKNQKAPSARSLDEGPFQNTDRELWRERPGDYYSDSIHVTEGGGIGMAVGGHVIVMHLRDWHFLGRERAALAAPSSLLEITSAELRRDVLWRKALARSHYDYIDGPHDSCEDCALLVALLASNASADASPPPSPPEIASELNQGAAAPRSLVDLRECLAAAHWAIAVRSLAGRLGEEIKYERAFRILAGAAERLLKLTAPVVAVRCEAHGWDGAATGVACPHCLRGERAAQAAPSNPSALTSSLTREREENQRLTRVAPPLSTHEREVMEAWRSHFGELCDVLFPESVGKPALIGWKHVIAKARALTSGASATKSPNEINTLAAAPREPKETE